MAEILANIGHIQKAASPETLTKINRTTKDLSFSEVLKSRLEREAGVKFSSHAMERLRERGIILNKDETDRLNGAISLAGEKGVSDSLILINSMAFIVSIKNQTVVTAITGDNMKDNVFTNIDSTVIA
ncbi:MAG: flagellar biosynthesis protein [Candidatus Latescibacteria bacterium]|jgi:flagellar operon protein|nr:flagellar biosynthesis protein [Candidatus Latescibacterota bacterium]